MKDLLAVDVGQGIHQLINDFTALPPRRVALKKLIKGHAIDVLHDDARAELLIDLLKGHPDDVGMVEHCHQLILFLQQLQVDDLLLELGFQPFQHIPSSLPFHLHQLVESMAWHLLVGGLHLSGMEKLFLNRS